MAFQTGTASTFINLLDALRLFATANGWTENLWALVGSDRRLHLQNGDIYANFYAEAAYLRVQGSLGFNGSSAWNAQPSMAPWEPRLHDGFNGAITWPVTYWFFSHSAPASIEVVIRYQPTRVQWLMVGELAKYGTWTGGAYFGASEERQQLIPRAFLLQVDGPQTPVLFHETGDAGGVPGPRNTTLHAQIDSQVWWSSYTGNSGGTPPQALATRHCWPLVNRSLSAFNGLATLTPIVVHALRPDAHYSPLGRVEHVRYANVLNHALGDIIDIGGQRWMLFPWLEKGGATDATPTALHAGMAIKYDGP